MIVSSGIAQQWVQADGQIHVRERFTDHLGNVYEDFRIYSPGADPAAHLAEHAAILENALAEAEAMGVVV